MSQSTTSRSKRSRTDSTLGGAARATGTTRNTTPYDPNFEQTMIDGGVYPPGYRGRAGERPPKPQNMQELQAMLGAQRQSLSPSVFREEDFEEFQDRNVQASREAGAMADVMPVIAGQQDRQFRPAREVLYTNAAPIVLGVSKPKPDIYYGAPPSQIDVRVRRDLSGQIIPSQQDSLPAAPNFSLEGKSKAGGAEVAQRQVMNNGAYGARAMHSLKNYGGTSPVYDGNAYTIGATYVDGQLKLYASHPVQVAGRPTGADYHMTQLDSYAMTGNINGFRQGAAAYRNAREWTQEQRDSFITTANANAGAGIHTTDRRSLSSASTRVTSLVSSVNPAPRMSSDTSADELAGPVTPLKRRRRRRQ